MAEPSEETKKPEEGAVDLSQLSSMSLGPDWGTGKKPQTRIPRNHGGEERSRGPRKDRRGSAPRRRTERPERSDRGPRDSRDRGREERQPFEPVVAADFYPEEEPFAVLAQAIRKSCRTFELFEIARLILEKPDRFVCVVRDPAQKEGDEARLYASVPDGLPFRSEEEALNHAIRHYLGEFFTMETIEGEPPSGSFQLIHKCGFTGELLAPPNYHRYQAICREHHATKLAHMPYARFEQRLESTREEEDIQKWLEKMKQQTRYTSKEDASMTFTNLEDARLYLVTQSKDKLVRPAYSARFSGKALALLNPGDPIRRSVETLLEGQRKFPLDTANHLRGRLRRMNFAVYKRGSKGISFVCAVKRRFRKPDEVLADNLQELIDFIEAHPNFPAKDLPKGFLGIDPAKKPAASPETETGAEMAREVAGENGEQAAREATAQSTSGAAALDEPEMAALRQLKTDLHYLVSEGYVTEYSDGRLYVPPIREEEIRHAERQKAANEAPPAEPKPEAESTPSPAPEIPTASETAPQSPPETAPVAEPASDPGASQPVPEPGEETAKPEADAVEPDTEGDKPDAEAADGEVGKAEGEPEADADQPEPDAGKPDDDETQAERREQ
jgi:hypothetical protein